MSSFYNLDRSEVLRLLDTRENGLSSQEALLRQKVQGKNVLPSKKPTPLLFRFLSQFSDFLIILLLFAAGVSFYFGEMVDAGAIIFIVFLNALIGFIQEYKAEQALALLKQSEVKTTRVFRDGNVRTLDIAELVPGDIIVLEAGDKVPADARIIEAYSLKTDEALLTGESVPVEKKDAVLPDKTVLAEQYNMLFRDTTVLEGKVRAVVVKTGKDTEVGKIAALLEETKREVTPLQKELYKVGRNIALIIIVIAAIVFAILLRQDSAIEAFLTAVALSVAAIPEGMPAIVAVVLSIGVLTLARKKTIVRKLKAVETLGSVKYLLTDKTGTLTHNKINLVRILTSSKKRIFIDGEGYKIEGKFYDENKKELSSTAKSKLEFLFEAAVVCNSAELDFDKGNISVIGDTTEGALLVGAERLGLAYQKIRAKYKTVFEEPFSSVSKRMLVVAKNQTNGKYYLFVKGAPEVIFKNCQAFAKQFFVKEVEAWASSGLRNLAIAYRQLKEEEVKKREWHLHKLKFLALLGQEDAVRKEAVLAVSKARQAGIETIMLTGDHRLAALAIGRKAGIVTSEKQVMDGSILEGISDKVLLEKILMNEDAVRVFSRVSPQEKLRIVKLIKEGTGAVVAVTGDGVNDAPSIKAAHVGVAMGITGSDVTKEVADVILADDNYSTLVDGIFQGRVIFDNLVKFIRYLLSCNIGEIVVVFVGTLMGQLHILLPVQILFINLVTDSLPALGLGFEKGSERIMIRKPRQAGAGILTLRRFSGIFFEGAIIGSISLFSYFYFLPKGFEYARTVAFLVLILTQLLHSLNNKSEDESLLNLKFFDNRFLLVAILLSFFLSVVLTQTGGFLQSVFKTQPIIYFLDWMFIFGISLSVIFFVEVKKMLISLLRL